MDGITLGAVASCPSPMTNCQLWTIFPLEAGEHGLTVGQAMFPPKSLDQH